MPTITIQIPLEEIWLNPNDFDGYDYEDYEYNYDYCILQEEIVEIFCLEYGVSKEIAYKIISDADLWDVYEEMYEYDLEEALKERLYDDAYEEYLNSK